MSYAENVTQSAKRQPGADYFLIELINRQKWTKSVWTEVFPPESVFIYLFR